MRPALEVADIFRRHGQAFRHSHDGHLGRVERRVMAAIEACRTPAPGDHVEQCGDCGLVRCAYNSCRNRHSPKCQGLALDGTRWVACRPGFFLPMRVLSQRFRELFVARLAAAFAAGDLRFSGMLATLAGPASFARRLDALRGIEWVVYAKPRSPAPSRCRPIPLATPTASPSPTAG